MKTLKIINNKANYINFIHIENILNVDLTNNKFKKLEINECLRNIITLNL